MQKKHTPDILSGKLSSRFVAVLEDDCPGSMDCFWNCLIRQASSIHPCLVVSSGYFQYPVSLSDKIAYLYTDTFDCARDLLKELVQHARDMCVRRDSSPVHIFIDCFSWALLECPKEAEFEFWIRHVLGMLSEISCSNSVSRLVIAYRPIRDRCGTLIAGSDTVLSVLDQCVSTLIKLEYPVLPISPTSDVALDCRICQKVMIWHSRARQTELHSASTTVHAPLKNKPAMYESLAVEMDLKNWIFSKFSEPSRMESVTNSVLEPSQPESTFVLTLSESEKIARSQIVLPYEAVSKHSRKEAETRQPTELTIHYQPDCFDDLDDEDPDDDLGV